MILILCCDLQNVQTFLDVLQPAVDNVVPEDLWTCSTCRKYFDKGQVRINELLNPPLTFADVSDQSTICNFCLDLHQCL
jgi:hypothetical protein